MSATRGLRPEFSTYFPREWAPPEQCRPLAELPKREDVTADLVWTGAVDLLDSRRRQNRARRIAVREGAESEELPGHASVPHHAESWLRAMLDRGAAEPGTGRGQGGVLVRHDVIAAELGCSTRTSERMGKWWEARGAIAAEPTWHPSHNPETPTHRGPNVWHATTPRSGPAADAVTAHERNAENKRRAKIAESRARHRRTTPAEPNPPQPAPIGWEAGNGKPATLCRACQSFETAANTPDCDGCDRKRARDEWQVRQAAGTVRPVEQKVTTLAERFGKPDRATDPP